MWKDDNTNYNEILKAVLQNSELPIAECCKNPMVHYFLYEYKNHRGSAWIWCSRCKAFCHYDGVPIPKGYVNFPDITVDDLSAIPQRLEEMAATIDIFNRANRPAASLGGS